MRSCSKHAGIRKRFFLNNAVNEMKKIRLSTNNNNMKKKERPTQCLIRIYESKKRQKTKS
jgi:hypothetical protein